jgi:hypothetical protein
MLLRSSRVNRREARVGVTVGGPSLWTLTSAMAREFLMTLYKAGLIKEKR